MITSNETQYPRWYRIRYWDNKNSRFYFGFWYPTMNDENIINHIGGCIDRTPYMEKNDLYFADIETSDSVERPKETF